MSKQAERDFALRVEQTQLYKKPYHCPRVFREFPMALELLQSRIPNGSILDMGCGPGWATLGLARAGYDAVGVDIAERMIEVARERSTLENTPADFLVADMEELDLHRRDFDGVLFFDCLHHCPRYREALRRAHAHLKPGGWILLFETTWLHRISPHARDEARTFGITELGFTRRQLRRALTGAGFRNLAHYHDPGPVYRGFLGFVRANLRLWADYLWCYPQAKNIIMAQKA